MKLSCPSCGAEVQFKSRFSTFGVCSFCQSTLVYHNAAIENLGKMSALPQDMSPLQIGTSGNYEHGAFEVVGRQKISWNSGTWNEWYLHFHDGRDGWLADAQGHYMLSFELKNETNIPRLSNLKISSVVKIRGKEFSVNDIREVTCVGSQGELPVKSVQGRTSTSVDLIGPYESFANLDYAMDGSRLFLGKYVEFDDLHFLNLREIDDW